MAVDTLWPIHAIMYVLQCVAVVTGFGHILVFLINMADIAGRITVGTMQREVGLVMVEIELSPVFRRVTTVAIIAQVSLVGILPAVTAVTGRCRLGIFFTRLVTGTAGNRGMRTLQGKIGLPMVKGQRVEPDNVGVPTKVFAVTAFTRRGRYVGKTSVVTRSTVNIPVDVFVAVEA